MESKKYYWLKLKKDFFKRHDIRIVESMPSGKDYILFYLKLLCESVDHDGNLRFNDQIPYNDSMLATITNTDINIVSAAINVFEQLNMIEIMDDGTYYMNEVEKMLGFESEWAEKKRLYREKQRTSAGLIEDKERTMSSENRTLSDKSKRKSKSKSIEIDKEVSKNAKRFTPPTVEEVRAYCQERGNHVDPERFVDFYSSKGWMVGKNHMKDWRAAVRTWERDDNGHAVAKRVGANGIKVTGAKEDILDGIF